MGRHTLKCRTRVLERGRPVSYIVEIMSTVVDQKLRNCEAFQCRWLYIEMIYLLSITTVGNFVNNCWVYNDCWYVFKVSVNGVLMILSFIFLVINELHGHILPTWLYWIFLHIQRKPTCSVPHRRNVPQWCINDSWCGAADNETKT